MATPPSRAGWGGAGQGFGGFNDIFENIFGEFMGGGQRQPQRGNDVRYDLEVSFEDAFNGSTAEIAFDVAVQCDTCDGSGGKPGAQVRPCNTCGGRGQVRMQNGLFIVERTCPQCHGQGRTISDPCGTCRGEGPRGAPQDAEGDHSQGRGRRHAHPHGGAGRGRPARHAARRPVHLRAHEAPPDVEARGHDPVRAGSLSFVTAALGGEVEIPGLDRKAGGAEDSGGHADRPAVPHPRPRHAGAERPGLRRLVLQVDLETPTKLTARQRELLEEFNCGGGNCPKSTGLLGSAEERVG
jgi:molecular chaperone DnaJ